VPGYVQAHCMCSRALGANQQWHTIWGTWSGEREQECQVGSRHSNPSQSTVAHRLVSRFLCLVVAGDRDLSLQTRHEGSYLVFECSLQDFATICQGGHFGNICVPQLRLHEAQCHFLHAYMEPRACDKEHVCRLTTNCCHSAYHSTFAHKQV
jgi:hypothetical protein